MPFDPAKVFALRALGMTTLRRALIFSLLCVFSRFFDIFSGKLPIDLPEISLVQWSIYLLPCLLNF